MGTEGIERVDESFRAGTIAHFELGQARITEKLRKMGFAGLFDHLIPVAKKRQKTRKMGTQKPVELSKSSRFSRVLHEVQAQVEGRIFP